MTLGLVFGLRLRQAEGFLESVLQLMGLTLAVPDGVQIPRDVAPRFEMISPPRSEN